KGKAAPDGDQAAFIEGIDDQRDDRSVEEGKAEAERREEEPVAAHQAPSRRRLIRWNSMMGLTSTSSSAMATAAATGQSRLPKNSSQRTRPIIRLSGPPSREGITNSPTAGMKTSREPAMIPGSESGRVTVTKAFHGRQPRSCAASPRSGDSRSSAAETSRIMKGRK